MEQLLLGFDMPEITPQGDGSYRVRPGKPLMEYTPKQAAGVLGLARSSVYRLIEEGHLEARRPRPKKILITRDSLMAFRKASADPEFWSRVA